MRAAEHSKEQRQVKEHKRFEEEAAYALWVEEQHDHIVNRKYSSDTLERKVAELAHSLFSPQ